MAFCLDERSHPINTSVFKQSTEQDGQQSPWPPFPNLPTIGPCQLHIYRCNVGDKREQYPSIVSVLTIVTMGRAFEVQKVLRLLEDKWHCGTVEAIVML